MMRWAIAMMGAALAAPANTQPPTEQPASAARVSPAGCPAPLTPGDYTCTIDWAGARRSYLVHVPGSYTAAMPAPLVLDIHGLWSTAEKQRKKSGELAMSDRFGFIAVWPQSLNSSWNGFGCCGRSRKEAVDDIGFLRAVVAAVEAGARIDPARVFATGHSNGAAMAHRLACEAADLIRAAAPVSFPLNEPDRCHPSRPVTVVALQGTSDAIVGYGGGGLGTFKPAQESLRAWATADGCAGQPVRTPIGSKSFTELYDHCSGGVRVGLVTITGGLHEVYRNPEVNIAYFIWSEVFATAAP